MKCIKRVDRESCINSLNKIFFKTYEAFAKDTNESIRKSDTISNLQGDPKKTKLVLEQYDSDNDEENGNGVELSELEEKVFGFFF